MERDESRILRVMLSLVSVFFSFEEKEKFDLLEIRCTVIAIFI